MNFLLRVSCLFVLLINLISCATSSKTYEVKQCKALCMQRFASCTGLCRNNCSACSAEANRSIIENYKKYFHEKQIEEGYLNRGLKSYRDPLQCRKTTCDCYADLMTCEQNCTGIIQKQLRAAPYCS